MWHVYILKCSDDSFYVGLTNDLKQRIQDHKSGDGTQYTCARLPVSLEYSERFRSKKEALPGLWWDFSLTLSKVPPTEEAASVLDLLVFSP